MTESMEVVHWNESEHAEEVMIRTVCGLPAIVHLWNHGHVQWEGVLVPFQMTHGTTHYTPGSPMKCEQCQFSAQYDCLSEPDLLTVRGSPSYRSWYLILFIVRLIHRMIVNALDNSFLVIPDKSIKSQLTFRAFQCMSKYRNVINYQDMTISYPLLEFFTCTCN